MSSNRTSQGERESTAFPRAIIHKKILDAARERPDAAMDELASEVGGASTELVEQVLVEYGDPAAGDGSIAGIETDGRGAVAADREGEGAPNAAGTAEGADGDESEAADDETDEIPGDEGDAVEDDVKQAIDGEAIGEIGGDEGDEVDGGETGKTDESDGIEGAGGEPADGPECEDAASVDEFADAAEGAAGDERTGDPSGGDGAIDPSQLSERERETLRAIAATPEATQREIADRLGVSAATISQRVSAIDGFSWGDRADLIGDVFDDAQTSSGSGAETPAGSDPGSPPDDGESDADEVPTAADVTTSGAEADSGEDVEDYDGIGDLGDSDDDADTHRESRAARADTTDDGGRADGTAAAAIGDAADSEGRGRDGDLEDPAEAAADEGDDGEREGTEGEREDAEIDDEVADSVASTAHPEVAIEVEDPPVEDPERDGSDRAKPTGAEGVEDGKTDGEFSNAADEDAIDVSDEDFGDATDEEPVDASTEAVEVEIGETAGDGVDLDDLGEAVRGLERAVEGWTERLEGLAADVEALGERVQALESSAGRDRSGTRESAGVCIDDPELAAKVVRACVQSDGVSEAEELRIIESLLTSDEGR